MAWAAERPVNDVDSIRTYRPGSEERRRLAEEIARQRDAPYEVPVVIGGRALRPGTPIDVVAPEEHGRVLAKAFQAGPHEMAEAAEAALRARERWAGLDWSRRAAVFTKAATLLAGPRRTRNIASIVLNLSKNPYEAEIDLAELVDFWNFNAFYARQIYDLQPFQHAGETNRFDWRPLEGFVLAITPFNFYSIAGNLPTAPALLGNVAVWKPARSVLAANYEIFRVLEEAGLPPGVINFVPFASADAPVLLDHPDLAGIHFTGSYTTLTSLWKRVGQNIDRYRNFPRIVGETGGKDFAVLHPSADVPGAVANLVRGAFEYQGQKCSACSRAYVPESLWPEVERRFREELARIPVGPVSGLESFMGAVIDATAYRQIAESLEYARAHPEEYRFVVDGGSDPSRGWFIRPTLLQSLAPKGRLMTEEIFGPVLTVYVYPDREYSATLDLVDGTSPYALTGAVFARDPHAIAEAERRLRWAAGNFYVNDKPTGAIVGRQPFGGARHSGTNDKAGSLVNLLRWVSPRNIKESADMAREWHRPFLV